MNRKNCNKNRGHRKGPSGRNFFLYTIYDNRTDEAIVYDRDAKTCARLLGVTVATFYCMVNRVEKGKIKRLSILKRYADEEE